MEKENIFFKEWWECRSREWKTSIFYDVLVKKIKGVDTFQFPKSFSKKKTSENYH
jgi:hypothetical protein